jgi:hypothetical protein
MFSSNLSVILALHLNNATVSARKLHITAQVKNKIKAKPLSKIIKYLHNECRLRISWRDIPEKKPT